ncbi:GFA family protein [Entomomonas asaccharolytica]|uniref:GFA family protein n=1 Tax=Entomomonas asaccharolytica TaxID=2785331 RepID=A0A974RWL5_9GAMM|nr:GFA family protein [Entomomonas asaccharolytica]QQP85323.1 GFA family protein [Entomomonas asaccharolytica]
MKKTIEVSGNCLCGAVKVSAKISNQLGACHCGFCRHWGGGPLFCVDSVEMPQFDGEGNIAVYSSSEWAERAFCKCCGSHLYYQLKGEKVHYSLSIGLFDNLQDIEFISQIYIDKKPDYYTLANNTEKLTEAEVIALYFPKE